ncbi:NmrA-like protein [Kalmanozyma brasiliensis GHG001]|uniref:NmrA-like domain-containing protein n=1 Tax=Kalmanozyma brasiliensis (strain GHG001) TaxID=1365824 RepID=V5ECG0_KALBG|nr:NmrA-like protein [Kalmanozyma brasiliensis GHG001]EST08096.1 NmrA-like protein [Kalmanozyma brasiliensis GHG001]
MSSAKKLLTVFGATGNQGGSLIRTVLNNSTLNAKYSLRGVTRDTSKPAAQELSKQGVEVVRADLDDVESLKKAIDGSYGVLAVTNFWESMDGAKETQQGRNIVDASLSTGVKHLVLSTLHSVDKLSNGTLHTPHFDSKSAIDDYAKSQAGNKLNISYFHAAFFAQNFETMLQKGEDGSYSINLPIDPAVRVPMIDIVADTGNWVAGLFEAGDSANGKKVQGVSWWTNFASFSSDLGSALGKKVSYNNIPADIFKSYLPESIADELTDTMKLVDQYSYYGKDTEKQQADDNRFLLKDAKLATVDSWAKSLKL